MNKIKKYFYFLYLPLLLIIRLISKFYLIRFGELISERIGHFVCCMELYLCEKDHKINQPKGKFLDLFIMGKKISNKQIKTFFRRKFIILPRFLLGPLINLNNIISGGELHDFYFRKNPIEKEIFLKHRDVNNLLDISNNHFKFSKKEIYTAQKLCNKIGVDLNKKTVIINLRDDLYFKRYHSSKDLRYWEVKNCDIDSYKLAIEHLIKNNYQVIRLGKGSIKKVNISDKNFFDLTNHNLRSDLLELFLLEKSSFVIGCNSGFTYAALFLYKKYVYISNVLPLGIAFTSSNKVLTNFKYVICKKTREKLTMSQMYNKNLFFYEFTEEYERNNLYFKEIEPEIICKSVDELILRSENKWVTTNQEKELRNKFIYLYTSILKKNKEIKLYDDLSLGHHQHGIIKCHFGFDYLKTNQEFIQ